MRERQYEALPVRLNFARELCGSEHGEGQAVPGTSVPFQIQAASARMKIMKNPGGKRREDRLATVLFERSRR
jgi:hypothetical protein